MDRYRRRSHFGYARPVFTLVLVSCIFAAFYGLSRAQPSSPGTQMGFIDTQAVLASMPGGGELLTLYKQREEELRPLAEELATLGAETSAGLSPAEQERVDLLRRTLEAAGNRWEQEINAAAAPLEDEVNMVLKAISEDRGILVVFDIRRAQQFQLVAYADPSADLTKVVIAALGRGE